MTTFSILLSAATAVELELLDNAPELPEFTGIVAKNASIARDKAAEALERLGYHCDTMYINDLELFAYDEDGHEYVYWADEE